MINVFPNKELMGQILSYGSFLEVLSPDELRNTIRNELAILSERYK
jgi:predicted DNA-binding transcriptional regulator YafY